MWPSVRRGEEENIFPYQENADAYFNSALLYELSVLKQFAEPLLFSIRPDQPEYEEAKRLALELDQMFGHGNFFLELQDSGLIEQKKVNYFFCNTDIFWF